MKVLVLLAALLATPLSARGADAVAAPAEAALKALESAWNSKNQAAYVALWDFPDAATREAETELAAARLSEGTVEFTLQRPGRLQSNGSLLIGAQAFSSQEPRGRLEQLTFTLAPRDAGWRIVSRVLTGQLDGLVHLSLDPQPFKADGLKIQLENFELEMARGSLFLPPENVGPTVVVFIGEGTVRVRPRPPDERAQLVQYHGKPEIVQRVRSFFMRLHPGDLHRLLVPMRLQPDPRGASHFPAAERLFRTQVVESHTLDTALPGAPWWLLPSLGDALVSFPSARGMLTFAVSRNDPEGLSLFDRAHHRHILLYPVEGRTTEYDEDENRSIDVLSHDLSVRFSPSTASLEGETTLRIRLLTPSPTVRLRLHGSLRVTSVRSTQGGDHLFFRVRRQDSLVVSLGALAARSDEISLTVRFSGQHRPDEVESEVLQTRENPSGTDLPELDLLIEEVLVYSNRTAWYPQGSPDDHARATVRFDVPATHLAITGGSRKVLREEGNRRILEFVQDVPGKYITAAVGRLTEVARREGAGIQLVGYSVGRSRSAVPATLDATLRILAFYREEFGPMPFAGLNVVLIEGRAPGGHSPPGMVVLSNRPPMLRNTLRDDPASFHDLPTFFLAHELAHQWWGHGVSGQNYRERWIAEGFAQYAAALWIRKTMGEAPFRSVLDRMGRWAQRKTDLGPIHLGHRLGHVKGDAQIYRAVVYDKGAYVLHMLRGIMGEEAFRQGLTALQRDNRLQKIGTEDVRQALEKASSLDLRPYFQAWVYGTALPVLTVSRRTEVVKDGFLTVVGVATRDLPGPVPLQISLGQPGRPHVQTVTLPAGGGRFEIHTRDQPGRLELNADRGLLASIVRSRDR